jgi:hypothetical protein
MVANRAARFPIPPIAQLCVQIGQAGRPSVVVVRPDQDQPSDRRKGMAPQSVIALLLQGGTR